MGMDLDLLVVDEETKEEGVVIYHIRRGFRLPRDYDVYRQIDWDRTVFPKEANPVLSGYDLPEGAKIRFQGRLASRFDYGNGNDRRTDPYGSELTYVRAGDLERVKSAEGRGVPQIALLLCEVDPEQKIVLFWH